jgi:hypothetical protein
MMMATKKRKTNPLTNVIKNKQQRQAEKEIGAKKPKIKAAQAIVRAKKTGEMPEMTGRLTMRQNVATMFGEHASGAPMRNMMGEVTGKRKKKK